MNRARTATAALTVAAASLLAPAVASANPELSAASNGAPITGEEGAQGQPITISGTGCPNDSGTAVMGEFVSQLDDPWVLGDPSAYGPDELYQFEFPVDEAGSFTWDVTIPVDNGVGVFQTRWYCASTPVESMTDPQVLWVSPPMSMDIAPTENPVALRSLLGSSNFRTNGDPKGDPASNGVSFDVDPEALPAVDKIAIPGAPAAKLKAKVDTRIAKLEKDRRTLGKALWMLPSLAKQLKAPATSTDYVNAAYKELTGKAPSAKALKASKARLDAGQLKVHVVEDIALTAHDAAWWIRKA